MPRIKPKKINYMDMKIPFETFRIPKAKAEQLKLIKRFETEFGKDYMLDQMVDPCDDVDDYGNFIYVSGSVEEKIERIKRRNECVRGLAKAIAENDEAQLHVYSMIRKLPALPESDNGFNVIYKDTLERSD